jgi:hypothetical protein
VIKFIFRKKNISRAQFNPISLLVLVVNMASHYLQNNSTLSPEYENSCRSLLKCQQSKYIYITTVDKNKIALRYCNH